MKVQVRPHPDWAAMKRLKDKHAIGVPGHCLTCGYVEKELGIPCQCECHFDKDSPWFRSINR